MKPDEVRALPSWCLRLIVLVEARAAPRLRTVEGLWRRSTRTRPGRMTDFIRAEALLPAADLDAIIHDAPAAHIRFPDVAAHVPLPHPQNGSPTCRDSGRPYVQIRVGRAS